MAKVLSNGQMEAFIEVTGRIAEKVEKESLMELMAQSMKANGQRENIMERDHQSHLMGKHYKEYLEMESLSVDSEEI